MSEVYDYEKGDFDRFWDWWLNLKEFALEIVEPNEDGTKTIPLPNQMMIAAYAAVNWEKHKERNGGNSKILTIEQYAKTVRNLRARLHENELELSKLKAELKKRAGSKKQSKEGKIND